MNVDEALEPLNITLDSLKALIDINDISTLSTSEFNDILFSSQTQERALQAVKQAARKIYGISI